VLDLLYLKIF